MFQVWLIMGIISHYAKVQCYSENHPCNVNYNQKCPDPNIKFSLFTKNHTIVPEIVRVGSHMNESNLQETAYNISRPTKIIIHGYSNTEDISSLLAIRNEYLKTRDYNIFTIDWTALVETRVQLCYAAATWNIRHVGKCSSQLIRILLETGANDIHLIGFSLGAQVSNHIAINLRPFKISRITGLDPALPLFVTPLKDEKLDRSDADFVDVYHTNAFLAGKAEQMGHVDFYMNGGATQPGCLSRSITDTVSCNHNRAPIYFAESINSKRGFWGWSCSWFGNFVMDHCPPHEPMILMGEMVNRTARGTYFVKTNSTPPYALGRYIK